MKRSWLALILACGLLGGGTAAAEEEELSDGSRAQLNELLKESLGQELYLHVRDGRLACVCPNGKQLRVALPELLGEEVSEEAVEDAAKRLTEVCEGSGYDPDTAAVLLEEQQARAPLLVKINEKKGNKIADEGQHPALLVLDTIGGLLMLFAIGWALVVIGKARPKAPRLPKPAASFDVDVDFQEQAAAPNETMEVNRDPELQDRLEAPLTPPQISLPEEIPFGEPIEDASTGFEMEDAATVLVDDKEMVAEVRAKVAAWQQERDTSAESTDEQGAQSPSAFAQVASTEPIPAAAAPRSEPVAAPAGDDIPELEGELVDELPAPDPAATVPPVPADVAPTEPPSPAPVPAALPVMAPAPAAVDLASLPSQYIVCREDPRGVIGKAAADAIESVRSKLFDGSLLIEVMSEGGFSGEIAINSEYPDRHPVSQEECIRYLVVAYSDLMWRPVSGGIFRTMHGEVALEADGKHPWLLVLDLSQGQKFHQALLPLLVEAVATAAGGARVPAQTAEQVDRDWMEMAQED